MHRSGAPSRRAMTNAPFPTSVTQPGGPRLVTPSMPSPAATVAGRQKPTWSYAGRSFDHVGSLVAGPPGHAGLPFSQSSDDFGPAPLGAGKRTLELLRLHYCMAVNGEGKWIVVLPQISAGSGTVPSMRL